MSMLNMEVNPELALGRIGRHIALNDTLTPAQRAMAFAILNSATAAMLLDQQMIAATVAVNRFANTISDNQYAFHPDVTHAAHCIKSMLESLSRVCEAVGLDNAAESLHDLVVREKGWSW